MSQVPVSRRDFLKSSAWAAALFGLPDWAVGLHEKLTASYMSFTTTNHPIEWSPPADLANSDPAILILNRIAFGPRPGDLENLRAIGVDQYIEQQLSPDKIDDSQMDKILQPLTALKMSVEQLGQIFGGLQEQQRLRRLKAAQGTVTDPGTAFEGFLGLFGLQAQDAAMGMSPQQVNSLLAEVVQATVLRQVFSERQLFEVMVDFWSNHFNIYMSKNQDRFLKIVDDREVIRKNALGKFSDLLLASAHSPAMLVYLDNVTNIKGVPNENYARELMELHTLGVNGGYNQRDVQELARCFTGWSVSAPQRGLLGMDYGQAGDFQFRANQHDDGEKQVLGLKLAAGGGIRDAEQVLDLLAHHPNTAKFVSTKLVRRLVGDDPPASLVQRAADAFTKSEGDIRTVLSTILHSEEFKQSFGLKIKRPLEYVASAIRAVDGRLGNGNVGSVPLNGKAKPSVGNGKNAAEPIVANALRTMGQVPFAWESPNGYPDLAAAWINTNNMLARWNFALALTSNKASGIVVDLGVAMANRGLSSPEQIVDFWTTRVINRAIPDGDRANLIKYLNGDTSPTKVGILVALILSSPHFQYR